MLTGRVLGIEIPDEGPVFATILVVHVAAGLTCVVAGATAALARKRRGRHPRAGRVYYTGIWVVFATATALSIMRWEHNRHLFVLGMIAFAAASVGYGARRRQWRGWVRWHIVGMGSSYIVLLTAFYVDNGPQLPLWNRLPVWALWLLPTVVGAPLVARALWVRPGGRINPSRRVSLGGLVSASRRVSPGGRADAALRWPRRTAERRGPPG